MISQIQEKLKIHFQILLLAAGSILLLFLLQGDKGFNLWDEGFLWYGAQRAMIGEVPIRDFMAYDPGRYYWSASLMALWGDNGIMALRCTVAIVQAVGLFIGCSLISRSTNRQGILYLILSTITLAVWMYPRHKLFDVSLSIMLIGILTFLVQNPTRWRYFITGLCIGLVAFFGRNHGLYGVAGSLGIMAWMTIKRVNGPSFIGALTIWAGGVAIGYMPNLLMMLFLPGYATAFWESIRFLFEIKTTNLSLPVPWPWNVPIGTLSIDDTLRGILIGLFFILSCGFGLVAITWVVWQRKNGKNISPPVVASAFLSIPYSHYIYSRADIGHLALGIFPFLIGSLAALSKQSSAIKWPLAVLLCGCSLWVMHSVHPGCYCYFEQKCEEVEISGSKLKVEPSTAAEVRMLTNLAERFAPHGQSFVVAPFWPGAYALLERKAPMWEIYALWPRGVLFEKAEIERIKDSAPVFALISDDRLDGRDELRFRYTHPLIYQYIMEHFEAVPGVTNPSYQFYRIREVAQ